ncbi:MAG: ScpA family protein [Candidatus Limnocylindrales bacterium]
MTDAAATYGTMVAPRRGAATVRVESSARPDRGTHVSIESFDGPLALLLSLIEQQRLDILEVSLGDLAGAYLEQMVDLTDEQLPHLSAFIGVSSQLILIKSRALLPRVVTTVPSLDGERDPEAELRARLLVYKRFRDAAAVLAQRPLGGLLLAHREAGVAAAAGMAGARPPTGPTLDPTLLVDALTESLRLVPPQPPPAEIVPRTVTLAERTAIIRAALRGAPIMVLQELLSGIRDRVVVAVTFMAMLELVKTREVTVEQAEPWGPILCRRVIARGSSA